MNKKTLFTFFAILGIFGNAWAQDTKTDNHTVQITIPEIFILDLEPATGSKNIVFSVPTVTEAGNPLSFATTTNSNLWLNFTSIKGSATETRDVTVAITSGTLPTGIDLKVSAAAATGGIGDLGTHAAAPITLNGSAQKLITGIGSAYTENGPNKGYNLTYNLGLGTAATAFASLVAASATSVTVTYTITDN